MKIILYTLGTIRFSNHYEDHPVHIGGLLLSIVLCFLYLLLFPNPLLRTPAASSSATPAGGGATSIRHLLFGIASSSPSWPRRQHYLRLWWRPTVMRGFVFLSSPLLRSLLLSIVLCFLYLLLFPNPLLRTPAASSSATPAGGGATSIRHLLFGIASSSPSWPRRQHYLRLWWRPAVMRGFVFLDSKN